LIGSVLEVVRENGRKLAHLPRGGWMDGLTPMNAPFGALADSDGLLLRKVFYCAALHWTPFVFSTVEGARQKKK
jgi:hypothetical protein